MKGTKNEGAHKFFISSSFATLAKVPLITRLQTKPSPRTNLEPYKITQEHLCRILLHSLQNPIAKTIWKHYPNKNTTRNTLNSI